MKLNYCKEKHCPNLDRIFNEECQQFVGPYCCKFVKGKDNLIKQLDCCPKEELRREQIEFEYQRQILDL